MARVSILKTACYGTINIKNLMEPLGGMNSFVEDGDSVLLKINLLSPREPEKAVTTHPEFVRAVAREVKRAGGRPFIGDSPAGTFSKRSLKKAFERSGIKKMAEEEDIPLNYDTGARKIEIHDSVKLKNAVLCNYLFNADKVIALPKLKSHSFQYMTLASKVMYGVVPGLTKARYHALFPGRESFADMLLDIYLFVKPQLFIMDGVLAMEGQGPAGGEPVELGCILASTDGVAMDMAICKMIGIEPVGIPVLKRAKIRGLWPDKSEYPLLRPEEHLLTDYKLPNTAGHLRSGKRPGKKSPVISDKCISCGECEKICPKGAVKVNADIARVDYSRCIRCFCCHEICPENAIKLGTVDSR